MSPVLLIILGIFIVSLLVIMAYASWEVTFHNRNISLILEGSEPREHTGWQETICDRFLGRRGTR